MMNGRSWNGACGRQRKIRCTTGINCTSSKFISEPITLRVGLKRRSPCSNIATNLGQGPPLRIPAPIAYVVLYAALYAAFGAASPFWPKFFETRTLASQQIGLILAAAMLMRLVSGPLVSMLADLLGSLRLVLAGCAALAASAAVALISADTFWLLLLVALVQAAALAPTTSIADALSVNTARPFLAGRRFEYGWIRGSASAAFVLGTLTAGQLISPADLSPVVWLNAAFLVGAAGATALVPSVASRASHSAPTFPVPEMKALLQILRFRAVILVSALVYGSHAVHDAFAVIRWSDAGISTSAISFLWSEAVVAEVFTFLLIGPAFLDRFGVRAAAVLAAAAGIVRWSVAGATTSVLLLSLIQPLHGLTFALLHLACMRMMSALVATSVAATAQALYAFGSGLLTAILTLLSGALYASYAGAAFFPMAALCVAALPFAWFGFADERD
jgi:MFS transporter, PPP family, 3-phenylpropionic acid transporter